MEKTFKKSQAAMEFLMTYGWAILVVLVVIGALSYFGILSPENLLPERCSSGEMRLNCKDHSVSATAGTATFVFENGMGSGMLVTSVRVNNTIPGFVCTYTPTGSWGGRTNVLHINNGELATITTSACTAPGGGAIGTILTDAAGTKKKYKSSMITNWSLDDSSIGHTMYGELLAKVEQ